MAQLKEMAEEQAVSKSRFMACMSHDLRSPLHAIIGISDIMLGKREVEGRSRSLIRYVKKCRKYIAGAGKFHSSFLQD